MSPVGVSRASLRALVAFIVVIAACVLPAVAAGLGGSTRSLAGTGAVVLEPGTLLIKATQPVFLPDSALHRRHPRPLHVSHQARIEDGRAIAPEGAPMSVRRLIRAGNHITFTPYIWGGGHGSFDAAGYDCSGSVSYALHGARALATPVTSGAFASFGRPGPGRWVTIYANGGHVYMVVAGLRFDTSSHGVNGSRWSPDGRSDAGYVVRHPAGL